MKRRQWKPKQKALIKALEKAKQILISITLTTTGGSYGAATA